MLTTSPYCRVWAPGSTVLPSRVTVTVQLLALTARSNFSIYLKQAVTVVLAFRFSREYSAEVVSSVTGTITSYWPS